MKYKIFGRKTGLRVSEIALGAANFGKGWGHGADQDTARKIFERFIEAGGNFIDTADAYQFGESEEMLAGFIAERRDQLVLASKFTFGAAKERKVATTGNSRKNIMRSVEGSLKRLKTDRLDLYWAHFYDGQTPLEEIVRAFDDLVREGKILYAGLSNFPAWRIANASLLADLRGWTPIAGIQIEYSLIERHADQELLPMAESLGLGIAFWSPLAGGLLTGKYRAQENDPNSRKQALQAVIHSEDTNRETLILDTVEAVAEELSVKPLDVALAWLRQKSESFSTESVTIIGPRTAGQLEGYLSALEVEVSKEQFERLDEASRLAPVYPHKMIEESQKSIFGAITKQVEGKPPGR